MRRLIAVLAALCLAAVAVPAGAVPDKEKSIRALTREHIGPKHCDRYDSLHDWATREFGKKVVGRDVCRYGMPAKGADRVPTKAEFTDTMDTLRRWKNPPAPQPVQASTSYQPQASASGGGGCTGMSAESGSAGYGAYNPDGGYIGCYQIAPSHYNGGSCSGLGTDPAGQDACARIICATEGPGAWTNSAGQNPCGRL